MIHWPFPGQEHLPPPPLPDLPPAKYAVGNRVESHWGSATVMKVLDTAGIDGTRDYQIHHDWSDAPPGFGHFFTEAELQPGRPKAQAVDLDEDAQPGAGGGERSRQGPGARAMADNDFVELRGAAHYWGYLWRRP